MSCAMLPGMTLMLQPHKSCHGSQGQTLVLELGPKREGKNKIKQGTHCNKRKNKTLHYRSTLFWPILLRCYFFSLCEIILSMSNNHTINSLLVEQFCSCSQFLFLTIVSCHSNFLFYRQGNIWDRRKPIYVYILQCI